MATLPLSGMRVVDFSQGIAGPIAAMLMADLGADVIKIEPPRGDWIRQVGRKVERGMSPVYVSMNRNKRAVCLELKDPRGLAAAQALAKDAAVIVESFRPGVMERFGLGYEHLRDGQPGLVYASVTGFGRTGPYVDYPGADSVIQAMGGIMSINGEGGGEPLRFGMFIVDVTSGMTAYQGILAALLTRLQTGEGQRVDVSLLDSIMAFQSPLLTEYLMHGHVPERNGNVNSLVAPSGVFRTKDAYLMFTALDTQWGKCCKALGQEALEHDPRFKTNADRMAHREELLEIVQGILAQRTTDEWLTLLREGDMLCAPINDYDTLVQDPQVLVNGLLTSVQHPGCGPMPIVANPVRFSGMEIGYTPPPLLGEHTREVLTGVLGMSGNEVDALLAAGVVRESDPAAGADVA